MRGGKNMEEKALICYLDENDRQVVGTFEIKEEVKAGLRIRGEVNDLIIPYNRLLKIKIKKDS